MHNELTNLLPPERQRLLSRDYLLRVGTVVAILAAILALFSSALLIPTYAYLGVSANAKKTELARITSILSSADEAELSSRLSALSENAAALINLSDAPSVSGTIREILFISRPGIALSGISFASSVSDSRGTAVVSGFAATRDALRSYQLALQDAPFARSATLPVSAYAKDSDIAFAITVTLVP